MHERLDVESLGRHDGADVIVRKFPFCLCYVRKKPSYFEVGTFNFAKLKVARVFALELKLSKTLSGLVYFVLQL